jgi:hypothetical protein
VPIESLERDLEAAVDGWDWSKGAHGHSLSLPARSQVHPMGRDHPNNLPFADRLKSCPHFRAIFDSFEAQVVSFRLLRKLPEACYRWHHDRNKGPGVIRFQIPIRTNGDSRLIVTDYREFADVKGLGSVRPARDETFDSLEAFKQANVGHYKEHVLQPGRLYYFDTSRLHNLVNRGSTARITLAIDVLANAALEQRYPEIGEEIRGVVRQASRKRQAENTSETRNESK